MPTLGDKQHDGKFRCMAFAPFKSGKTAGALTFPRPNVIDFDRGTDVVLAPWWKDKYKIDPKSIMYEQFQERDLTSAGVPKTHNAFDDATKYFEACMSSKTIDWKSPDGKISPVNVDMFDTWVIDSGTTLGEAARNKAIVLLGGSNAFTTKALSQTHKGAIGSGLIHMKMQDYGAERSLVEQFVDRVLASGKHVVLLCHAKDEYEGNGDDSKIVGRIPLLTGQSAERIPLKFNEVYWVELQKEGPVTNCLVRTSADTLIKRGSRMGLTDKTHWDWKSITTDLAKSGWSFSPS